MDMNFVPTRLYSNETSLLVVNKIERSSSILEFSATDEHYVYQGCIIEDWPGIVGMVIIRGYEELAFFDSKQVKVYKRDHSKKAKGRCKVDTDTARTATNGSQPEFEPLQTLEPTPC